MPSLREHSLTSTGLKLLRHGIDHMVSCHIAPTSRCNLKCDFCSVANREKHELSRPQIIRYLDACRDFGAKAVIITGGGEPLMYPHIEWLVTYLKTNGFAMGLITNGTVCGGLPDQCWSWFEWVRVSWTPAKRNVPRGAIGGTYGMSIVNPCPSELARAERAAMDTNADYLRVVPDCRPNALPLRYSPAWDRTFIQKKQPRCPQVEVCHQAFLRPYLHESGVVYPCDSVTLHEDRQVFDPKYKLCDLDDFVDTWRYTRFPFKPRELCARCVFADTVEMLDAARKVQHVDFV